MSTEAAEQALEIHLASANGPPARAWKENSLQVMHARENGVAGQSGMGITSSPSSDTGSSRLTFL